MKYPLDYFQLQVAFAQKVALIKEVDLMTALLQHTSFYKTFEIGGWDFDENNPTWKKFLNYVRGESDVAKAAYEFYLPCSPIVRNRKQFGCFSYDFVEKKNAIHIHFKNNDASEFGPLSGGRIDVRMQELKEMFEDVAREHPDAKTVFGFSWLYNVPAYTRLFPKEYISGAQEIRDWFKSLALWGQFLDKHGKIKKEWLEKFLACIENKTSFEELIECFPCKVTKPETSLEYFYSFYNIVK